MVDNRDTVEEGESNDTHQQESEMVLYQLESGWWL